MDRCDVLRSLHRPGSPLVLPNVWDVATAKAVVDAGFPVVATTSAGVAAALGYDDHEQAPPQEMLDAAARICRGVDVPVTVDAEAGYGMPAADLVAALREMGRRAAISRTQTTPRGHCAIPLRTRPGSARCVMPPSSRTIRW